MHGNMQILNKSALTVFTFQCAEFLTLFFLFVDGFIPGAVQAHHCDPDIRKCDQADRSTAQVSA